MWLPVSLLFRYHGYDVITLSFCFISICVTYGMFSIVYCMICIIVCVCMCAHVCVHVCVCARVTLRVC